MKRCGAYLLAGFLTFGASSAAFAEGDIEETSETVIERRNMPNAVSRAFETSDYIGWKVVETAKVETTEHGTLYEYEVKKNDDSTPVELYFGPDGELVAEIDEDS